MEVTFYAGSGTRARPGACREGRLAIVEIDSPFGHSRHALSSAHIARIPAFVETTREDGFLSEPSGIVMPTESAKGEYSRASSEEGYLVCSGGNQVLG